MIQILSMIVLLILSVNDNDTIAAIYFGKQIKTKLAASEYRLSVIK